MMKERVNKRNKKEDRSQVSSDHSLSAREKEILLMVASGSSDSEIAEELCISPDEVETYLSNIFEKIKAPNRLQAIFWTVKNL